MDIGKDLAKAFDYGYEQGKKDATQWISVKDRLPNESGDYIVWVGGIFGVLFYYAPSKLWLYGSLVKNNITHWMLKPEPPEGE